MDDNNVNDNNSMIYTGTSNLVLPVSNKSSFPPEFQDKSRLTYYASLFNSVEINSSFKKVPMAKTVAKWAESVPLGFRFTFKLWAEITHNKALEFKPADVERFIQVISAAGEKKGCLLVQFPGKLTFDSLEQFELLVEIIRECDKDLEWNVGIEFRNRSWYNHEIYRLLDRHKLGMVLHDMPLSATVIEEQPRATFVYVRFHGPEKGYRGSYSDEFLQSYAQQIKRWRNQGKTVYVYFNNTLGDAVNNLMTLNGMLGLD